MTLGLSGIHPGPNEGRTMAKAKAKSPATKRATEVEQPVPATQPAETPVAKASAAATAPVTKPADVIATIKAHLESKSGGTHAEILDDLVTKFPDRTRDGMHSTVKIQCNRLAKTTGRAVSSKDIQGRGRVYKFEDKGAIPGKEAVKAAQKPELASA
jgi:hypothetical protein